MRVDKYLWAVRAFKTRSMASQHCREGKVFVEGKVVKPAREVKVREVVNVRKGAVTFSYEVLSFPRSRVGAALVSDYMRDVTKPEEKILQFGREWRVGFALFFVHVYLVF